jgi:cytochrome c peroxidase
VAPAPTVVGVGEDEGKFKVPHLRNIALTAPYFHNGLISTLVEVVAFYNTRDLGSWAPPEVAENVNTEELGDLGLTSDEVVDLVAFLGTLTDGYEP